MALVHLAQYKQKMEELCTCSICFNSFDKVERKPKFLSCSHTFCLTCIKVMYEKKEGTNIVCAFCRKDIWIREVMVSGEIRALVNELPNNPYILAWINLCPMKNPRWCLECGKPATKLCRLMPGASHPTILRESASPRECRELQKKRSTIENNLESIIKKREDADYSLQQLSTLLESAQDRNKALDWASELKAARLTNDSAETFQSLYLELGYTSEALNEELEEKWQALNKDLEENRQLQDLDHLTKALKAIQLTTKIPKMISEEDFNSIDSYLFHLEFSRGRQNLGCIIIKPDGSFYRPLLVALARFCQPSPMVFRSSIVEAIPSSCATVRFSHPDFNQDVPDPTTFNVDASIRQTDAKLNVGFIDSAYDGNSMIGFQLVFLIQDQLKNCPLFGVIVEGSDVVDELSKQSFKERDSLCVSMQFFNRDD